MTSARLPLEGLKIVELGHYIAAPFATRLLADLGAEVVKVEPPEGDPVRGWGSNVEGHAVWFSVHGRNKLSVTLDLKKPADRDRLMALLRRADALVENFRAGYLERIGLGPEVLHAANPRLIIGRISGYGQQGPYRDKPAFGAIGEAMGGLRHLTANPGQTDYPPPRCGVSISDDLAGMYCAMAVVAACWQVKGDPAARGRVVDVDLVSSVFSLMEGMLPEYGLFGWVRQPQGAAIKTAVHRRQFRPDLPPPHGRDRAAGDGGRPALREQCRALRERGRAGCRDCRLDPHAGRRDGRGRAGSRRGAVLAPVRHGGLRERPAFPRPLLGDGGG